MINLVNIHYGKKYFQHCRTVVCIMLLLIGLAESTRAELECSSATDSSITLTWTAPGHNGADGTADQYDFRYSTGIITADNWSLATQITNEPTPVSAGTAQTVVISGLNPNTQYYFAGKTADEIPNWSLLSPVVSRLTLSSEATVPPGQIVDFIISASGSNSLALNWTAPDNGTGGAAFFYVIQYSLDSITTVNLSLTTSIVGVPRPLPAGSRESFTVTGLDPLENYYFTIRSCNIDFVWSEISNVVAGNTRASGAPEDVFAYPNPFEPATTTAVTFANIPPETGLLILTVSGDVVMKWSNNTGEDILWDGTNQSGQAVASGIYLWSITGTKMSGKVAVKR